MIKQAEDISREDPKQFSSMKESNNLRKASDSSKTLKHS